MDLLLKLIPYLYSLLKWVITLSPKAEFVAASMMHRAILNLKSVQNQSIHDSDFLAAIFSFASELFV